MIMPFAAALALLAMAPAPAAQSGILGTWTNPKGSIVVKTARCGSGVCGKIVWASREAEADARAAGAPRLVGTELLRGYRPAGNGLWQGEAFIPDLGGRFPSEISLLSRNELQIEGCRFGRLLCRRQVWRRGAVPSRGR